MALLIRYLDPEQYIAHSVWNKRLPRCLLVVVKESSCNVGDIGSIPDLGRSLGVATHFSISAGKSYGQRNLAGYSWGCKESDMTERLNTHAHLEQGLRLIQGSKSFHV